MSFLKLGLDTGVILGIRHQCQSDNITKLPSVLRRVKGIGSVVRALESQATDTDLLTRPGQRKGW